MLGKGAPISAMTGQLGSAFLGSGDGAKSGLSVGCISAIGTVNVTFSVLTSGTLKSGSVCMTGTLANIVLQPGQTIFGYWTAITVSAGTIIAYTV